MKRSSTATDGRWTTDPAATPAIERRDGALALIQRFNRWLVAGAVALAGLLSLAASQAFHGHTVGGGATAGASSAASQSSNVGGGEFGSAPSAPAPAPAGATPYVVAGGS